MDANQPPSYYVAGPSFAIQSMKPSYFQIMDGKGAEFLVRISAEDGSLTFGPNYTPDAAARVFWQALSEDYRKMLRWKATHPDAE